MITVGRITGVARGVALVLAAGPGVVAARGGGVARGDELGFVGGAVFSGLAAGGAEVVAGVATAAVLPTIEPFDQIEEKFDLFISNSITARFGSRGWSGSAISFPFIVKATAFASDFE
jgi:hypothetical protein